MRGVRVGVPVLWFNAVLKELVKLKSSTSCFDYSVLTTDVMEAGFKHVELVMNMCYSSAQWYRLPEQECEGKAQNDWGCK